MSSRVEGLPTYTGRANFSYISFQNVESRLHKKLVSCDERFDYNGIASRHEDRHKQVANIKPANPNSPATAKY